MAKLFGSASVWMWGMMLSLSDVTSGRVTRLVAFLNVIERVSVADRPVPRVLRLFA
jgi:hypothetical protein